MFMLLTLLGCQKSLTTVRRLGDLKQYCPRLQISDFETCKVNVVDIIFRFAKIV